MFYPNPTRVNKEGPRSVQSGPERYFHVCNDLLCLHKSYIFHVKLILLWYIAFFAFYHP